MSFDFKPQNDTPIEFHQPKVPVLGRFSVWLMVVVGLGVVALIAWRPARTALRDA